MSRYGSQHQALRRALMKTAYGSPCARCGEPMLPGQRLHLDHRDDGDGYLGMSHLRCNTRAGAVKTNRERAAALRAVRRETAPVESTVEVAAAAVAVEVSSDRQHTAIAMASQLEGDERVMLQLVGFLDGSTAGVEEVLRLRKERPDPLVAVVVDPMSPAATLVWPLQDADVSELVEPVARDAAVAGGYFMDCFAAKKLWFPDPHPALTAAIREVDLKSLAGAQTLDRRNPVVAPAVAAMWALWAVMTIEPDSGPQAWVF